MTGNQQFIIALIAAMGALIPIIGTFVISLVNMIRAGAKEKVDTVRHDQTMQVANTTLSTVNGQRDRMMDVVQKSTDATVAATVAVVAEQARSVAQAADNLVQQVQTK